MVDITYLSSSLSMWGPTGRDTLGRQPQVDPLADGCRHPLRADPKPTVTWRVTRSCNLNCVSCVYDSQRRRYESELTTAEGTALIDDLAQMRVPGLRFAGGEPLLRADLLQWVGYTRDRGIQPSLLTNGTLLSRAKAMDLKRAGLHSVAILLEGVGREVDCRRRVPGAFEAVLAGYENCAAAGLAVEIRIPLNRWNFLELAHILDFIERPGIRRVVFAHLVYSGRGNSLRDDLTHQQKRRALDLIFDRAEDFHRRGVETKIATDDNDVDGIYLYLRLVRRNPWRAASAYRLLQASGAAVQGAGIGLAGIDSCGDVHPDAYWSDCTLGNVREISFSEIWERSSDPLLRGLRNRLPLLKGRCADCRWKQACGGSLRVRAEEIFGDPWMSDPACYLTEMEIDKEVIEEAEAMEDNVLLVEQAA